MSTPAAQARDVVSFGPFRLVASERLLTKGGVPLELGARALDLLMALVSHPNEVVSKRDLLARVWPDVTVDEASLRFHIASLRKALGEGKEGARYITTLAGRGYCFVAPISRTSDRDNVHAVVADFPPANLPSRLIRMIGRADDVLMLSNELTTARFVTVVGAGGVGKTTVAIAVGNDLIQIFAGAILFVDLGMLSDPNLVAMTVASMLGLSVRSDDATPILIAYLRDKRILLILDTCEHLIEAVAVLASQIFDAAPQVHILATSREALRVEGEHVYKLDPLACPPDDPGLTAAVAQSFSATQLFVERAAAGGAHLDLGDADAAIVGRICRKLDGVALAIELAARRVEAYGLQQTAALLDQRLSLLLLGPRTGPPRQKTLHATLEWSFGLLSQIERVVLRRLAVLVGHFTLDAALAVVTSETVDQALAFGAIDSLVAKSMVATRPIGAMMRYRLLDTTRAYALEISIDDTEIVELATRHATYYRQWLEQTGAESSTLSSRVERASYFAGINNVRAALEWCFGVNGNVEIGVGLAAAAAPVFLAIGLLPECQRWSERAILALDDATRGGNEEMHLQAALGLSSMFGRGGSERVRVAFNRSLAIAEERGDVRTQVQALSMLCMLHGTRFGDFQTALHHAKRCSTVSKSIADPAVLALGHSMLGMSLHFTGDLSGARMELEAALEYGPGAQRTSATYLGFNGYILVGAYLGRTLSLQGRPTQAVERARQTVNDAKPTDHPVTLCIALVWAILVFLGTGDLQSAEDYLDWLISVAESHSFGPYIAVGRGFKGQLEIYHGNARGGVGSLQRCLEELHATRYEILSTVFNISLVQGLAMIGQLGEGMTLIDDTIRLVEANGDACYMPELLRVKGDLLLSMPQPNREGAEKCFTQSLELSRRQGAGAWELRTAVDLAKLLDAQGRSERAHALLQPVFEQFTEDLETTDLKAAERLLSTLAR
jgi:predicted ATPase/DNA-binding winged helix-turn-helix (wHTH) protein